MVMHFADRLAVLRNKPRSQSDDIAPVDVGYAGILGRLHLEQLADATLDPVG